VTQRSKWLSFHIYLGEYADRSDWLVREALPEIAGGAAWFYIHYSDAIGAHLRFRLRGDEVDADAVEDQLNQVVAELPERERSIVGPLVTLVGVARSLRSGPTGVRGEPYVTDIAKYRTERLAELAEEAFVESTRLVVDVFAAEHQGRISRKSLAPALLLSLVRLLPEDARAGFLHMYADFALKTVGAPALKDNFTNAGIKACRNELPVLLARDAMPAPIAARLDAWVRATAALLDAAQQSGEADAEAFRNLLLMDAIHLGNNRLGFNFVDEAYLALMVSAQLETQCNVD
jgi:hypothetical protein